MTPRTVKPEILDHLPADDPEARRSRRDLRRINFLMGNERRVCRAIRKHPQAAAKGIVEFGAGDGVLAGKIAHSGGRDVIEALESHLGIGVSLPIGEKN